MTWMGWFIALVIFVQVLNLFYMRPGRQRLPYPDGGAFTLLVVVHVLLIGVYALIAREVA